MSGLALGWEPSLHANSTGGPLGPSGSLSHLFPCATCVHSSPACPSSALWMKEHSPIQASLMLVTLTRRTEHARSCSVKPRAASEVVGRGCGGIEMWELLVQERGQGSCRRCLLLDEWGREVHPPGTTGFVWRGSSLPKTHRKRHLICRRRSFQLWEDQRDRSWKSDCSQDHAGLGLPGTTGVI